MDSYLDSYFVTDWKRRGEDPVQSLTARGKTIPPGILHINPCWTNPDRLKVHVTVTHTVPVEQLEKYAKIAAKRKKLTEEEIDFCLRGKWQ